MKRKIRYLALIPFYALDIAAGIHAGGSSHDNCAECNRAIGKKINTGEMSDANHILHLTSYISHLTSHLPIQSRFT